MAKMNPLFVDSTKFHGDLILTTIELCDVLIRPDEQLFLHLTNHQTIARQIQMKMVDSGHFEGRLHLNHQGQVSFQFVILKNQSRFLHSAIHQARVQYAISVKWEPVRGPVILPMGGGEDDRVRPPLGGARLNAAGAGESPTTVRSLIEKWGL